MDLSFGLSNQFQTIYIQPINEYGHLQNTRDLRVDWSNVEAVVRPLMEAKVEDGEGEGTDLAVTLPVGKEKVVVGWSLGPPQATKQASIVSKLFSLPAIMKYFEKSGHKYFLNRLDKNIWRR